LASLFSDATGVRVLGDCAGYSGRGLSRSGPENQEAVCSVSAFLCMSHAHEGAWAMGAALEAAQSRPLTEVVDPRNQARKRPNRNRPMRISMWYFLGYSNRPVRQLRPNRAQLTRLRVFCDPKEPPKDQRAIWVLFAHFRKARVPSYLIPSHIPQAPPPLPARAPKCR